MERSFAPIGQSMQHFILSETQAQVEGLNHVINQFVGQMNTALGGQFLQLGKTLSQINQAQTVSHESLSATMAAADTILESIQKTDLVTKTVMDRFDNYISELSQAQASSAQIAEQTAGVLKGMHRDVTIQNERYQALVDAQTELGRMMEQYAAWSGRVLEAVEKQSDDASDRAHEVANEMNRSGKLLSESYTSFVENITAGLGRTIGMFEENMREMTGAMVRDLGAAMNRGGDAPDLKQFARVQQALSDMTQALVRATAAAERMAEGA